MKKLVKIGAVSRETRINGRSVLLQNFDFDAQPVTTEGGQICYFYTTAAAGQDPRC